MWRVQEIRKAANVISRSASVTITNNGGSIGEGLIFFDTVTKILTISRHKL